MKVEKHSSFGKRRRYVYEYSFRKGEGVFALLEVKYVSFFLLMTSTFSFFFRCKGKYVLFSLANNIVYL
jgi:hypothetical protein